MFRWFVLAAAVLLAAVTRPCCAQDGASGKAGIAPVDSRAIVLAVNGLG